VSHRSTVTVPTRRVAAASFALAVLALLLSIGSAVARPKEKSDHEVQIGRLINNVRYAQDVSALGLLDGEQQARTLLAGAWDQGTPAQRTEFVTLFHHIFAGVAFPKMRDSFQHLTTTTYSAPETVAGRMEVASVLHIQAGPKEQELKVRYWLHKGTDGKIRVVDVTIQGDKSFLTNIRNDQIQPILAEGGWAKLLELMRARAKELPAPADAPMARGK
jgi:phospholipid transport system substrate-binding protein